jgi:ribosomal protein S18 acetylase RimI-like enzyme
MPMQILPLSPSLAPSFDAYNRAWISEYFVVEPIDDYVLKNPQEAIIDKGGEVWFAVEGEAVLGCYALRPLADGRLEFTKFAVPPHLQGRGIGKALLAHAQARACALGLTELWIYTSSSLVGAGAMYRKAGFVDMPFTEADRDAYSRADVMLKKLLVASA